MLVYMLHDLLHGMRSGHGQYFGMYLGHDIGAVGIFFCTKTTGNDHFAISVQCFANGVERLLNCGINETAGIDNDEIGTVVSGRGLIALGLELGQNLLGIDQCLGAAQGNKTDLGNFCRHGQPYFFPSSPGKPKPPNMFLACDCICSCICKNRFLV